MPASSNASPGVASVGLRRLPSRRFLSDDRLGPRPAPVPVDSGRPVIRQPNFSPGPSIGLPDLSLKGHYPLTTPRLGLWRPLGFTGPSSSVSPHVESVIGGKPDASPASLRRGLCPGGRSPPTTATYYFSGSCWQPRPWCRLAPIRQFSHIVPPPPHVIACADERRIATGGAAPPLSVHPHQAAGLPPLPPPSSWPALSSAAPCSAPLVMAQPSLGAPTISTSTRPLPSSYLAMLIIGGEGSDPWASHRGRPLIWGSNLPNICPSDARKPGTAYMIVPFGAADCC